MAGSDKIHLAKFWICTFFESRRVLFEVKDVGADYAKKILKSAAYKLPIKTRFVTSDMVSE